MEGKHPKQKLAEMVAAKWDLMLESSKTLEGYHPAVIAACRAGMPTYTMATETPEEGDVASHLVAIGWVARPASLGRQPEPGTLYAITDENRKIVEVGVVGAVAPTQFRGYSRSGSRMIGVNEVDFYLGAPCPSCRQAGKLG